MRRSFTDRLARLIYQLVNEGNSGIRFLQPRHGIDRKLARHIQEKNSVDCPPMCVIFGRMEMIGFGVDMDHRRGEHPYDGRPYEDRNPIPRA